MNELLLGFDVRSTRAPVWTAERRRQFLLRDVAHPLSVDPTVWPRPAILGGARGVQFAGVEEAQAEFTPDTVLVGITVVTRDDVEPMVPVHALEEPDDWPRWTFLGYDVADFVLLSGLSNCAWREEERQERAARWGPRFNDFHLVNDLHAALILAKVSDRRVPEHAPFFAFGVRVAPGSCWPGARFSPDGSNRPG